LRDIDPGLIELFVDGKEDGLPDAGRLDELGLGSGSVVFMLHRLDWRWDVCGSGMALSEGELVATKNDGGSGFSCWQLATGGLPMTEGRHYWEIELTQGSQVFVGAVRHTSSAGTTVPSGGRQSNADQQGQFTTGDRIGVLLDLDAGWMCIYRNGKRCGPGYGGRDGAAGVRCTAGLREPQGDGAAG
jgi:hypothetical protein